MVALPPARRTVGMSGRAPYSRQRQGSLTDEERSEILRLVGERSLRDIAADMGVSHETVRRVVLRDADKVA